MRQKAYTQFRIRLGTIALAFLAILPLVMDGPVAWAADPPEEPIDCRVYETQKTSYTVGFKVGNLLLNMGPEVTFSEEQGIAWERVVQGLIARYVELCSRYNAGLVSRAEYDQRIAEIEALYREAQELEQELVALTHARAASAHDELEGMTRGRTRRVEPEPVAVADSLTGLTQRIERIQLIGKPWKPTLKPKKPSPTPDMLGVPGRSC